MTANTRVTVPRAREARRVRGAALWYAGLAWLTGSVAFGHRASTNEKQAARGILGWPLAVSSSRRWASASSWQRSDRSSSFCASGMSRSCRPGEAGPEARRVVDIAGTVGYSARALVFAVIGVFLIRAAWEHDPSETIGLDGALLRLAQAPLGPSLLALVGPASVATPCGPRCRPVTARPERYARGVEAAASPQTLPWSWYVDPAVLATEQERVFPAALAIRRAP